MCWWHGTVRVSPWRWNLLTQHVCAVKMPSEPTNFQFFWIVRFKNNHTWDTLFLIMYAWSVLICRRHAPVRCWWRQTHVCWWTQMLDTTTASHMYSKFIDAWKMQICGGCAEHPSLEWPWILYHLLFWFGSVEIAQKDMFCVQVIDVKTKPHAYAKFNRASNEQMCIVCSDRPFI